MSTLLNDSILATRVLILLSLLLFIFWEYENRKENGVVKIIRMVVIWFTSAVAIQIGTLIWARIYISLGGSVFSTLNNTVMLLSALFTLFTIIKAYIAIREVNKHER